MSKNSKIEWNLQHLCPGDPFLQTESEFEKIRIAYSKFEERWRNDDSYLRQPKPLLSALQDYDELANNYSFVGKSGYYWILRNVQDQSNAKVKEMVTKVNNLETEMENKIGFFTILLAKVPEDTQLMFLKSSTLLKYRHFLKALFAAAQYTLSEPEEKIVSLLSQSAWEKWKAVRSEFIAREKKRVMTESGEMEQKTFEEILGLLSSKNENVRQSAGKQINVILKKHSLLAEHELNAILLTKKNLDGLRGATRPDELAHVRDDIDTSVVDTLISTVSRNFNLSQRFYKLKAKLLGKKQLEYYERAVEYGEIGKSYGYEEAVKLVARVFYGIDQEFGMLFESFIKDGLIDPFPMAGKSSGAACYHIGRNMPTYQFMSFTGRLNDVTTLAHESGHAINNVLARVQHALNYGTSLATAEVASTFMEEFVLRELEKDLSEFEQLSLNVMRLDDQIASVFRQTALYNFETELHTNFRSKQYFSAKEIGELFEKHMKSYMGDAVKFSAGSENWWVYWSHIRRPFYVYSYVSGQLIAQSLQHSVLEDGSFIVKVKDFLSAGTSRSPKDIFTDLGIDITKTGFWEKGIREFEELLLTTEELASRILPVGNPSKT